MKERALSYAARSVVRHGLRPGSPAAFTFAVLCVGAAAVLRELIDLVAPNSAAFATFYPAVLVAALVGGLSAGAFAILLSAIVGWWAFMPLRFSWLPFTPENTARVGLFAAAAALIVWVAAQYRNVVRRLEEEEHYRQVIVDELGHRVKNKLATIYAILRHELRGHDDIWQSVSGRLRALSTADDFLVRSDGKGADLRQILEMEMEPYDSSRIVLQGEPVLLFAKLPTVLALVFHELATNAAKYGALSDPNGRLTISWRTSGDRVLVEWVESGGPPVSEPSRRSFGSNLIERSLGGFGGSAKIEFAAAGVICRMMLPKPQAPVEPDSVARVA